MFYVVETEYVGPNRFSANDYKNILFGHYFDIRTSPGLTNMSHEPRTEGWLGTTSDWSRHAHGEFETFEEAEERIFDLIGDEGYREADEDDLRNDYDTDLIARYYLGLCDSLYDAEDYFSGIGSRDEIRRQLGITAETTDEEIETLANEEKRACEDYYNALLWGAEEYLLELRDEARES